MTDEALYDQRVHQMAASIARNPNQAAADAVALIALDAAALYLAARFGTREVAMQFYRRADAFAVVPERAKS